MIEVKSLTKKYGSVTAIDRLSFKVRPGVVTGFLGPNGAGKSTTMRVIVGLDRASSGSVSIANKPYRECSAPLRTVGTLLEARAVQPGRSARNHLLAIAQTNGISSRRVDEVLDLVGLQSVAKKRVGGFSLGMGQRLGIAVALLGNPDVLILDEPVNGLDPEGVLWIRNLLKSLAGDGKTVLVSSHLMSEVALTAEHLIVIARGRLVADATVEEFIQKASNRHVRVRSPQPSQLVEALVESGAQVAQVPDDAALNVTNMSPERIADVAASRGLTIYELFEQRPSLEQAFMELTDGVPDITPESPSARIGSSAHD